MATSMASNFNKWGKSDGQTIIRTASGYVITGWDGWTQQRRGQERRAIFVSPGELDDLIAQALKLRQRTRG